MVLSLLSEFSFVTSHMTQLKTDGTSMTTVGGDLNQV